jgi:hypothetical protein
LGRFFTLIFQQVCVNAEDSGGNLCTFRRNFFHRGMVLSVWTVLGLLRLDKYGGKLIEII